MPLVNLSISPTENTQNSFDFAHQQDHADIIRAITAQYGMDLPIRAIFPNAGLGADWKMLHQDMHTAMNQALGLPGGQNLQGSIDGTWYDQNYLEHLAAHQVLGF